MTAQGDTPDLDAVLAASGVVLNGVVLKLSDEQADFVALHLSYRAEGVMEENSGKGESPAAFLEAFGELALLASTIRELVEKRSTTAVDVVKKIAGEQMDNLQHGVGYESVALLRIKRGDPQQIAPGEDRKTAKKRAKKMIRQDTREALTARLVWEAIQLLEDEVLAEAGDSLAAERVRSRAAWARGEAVS